MVQPDTFGCTVLDNLYAAPVCIESSPSGSRVFSEQGLEVTNAMGRWMRFLSIAYFLGAATTAFFTARGLLTAGAFGFVFGLICIASAALMILVGLWLREAAASFVAGVRHNEPSALGAGFRTLRRYFILLGFLQAFNLAATTVSLLHTGAMS